MVEDQVEAIDLNLGCPQNIARKGHYGSYLQDEWNLIRDIISTLHRSLRVPVTAKIRIFDDMEKSIRYARMVEEAGAQLICIHGRTREQRGDNTGLANWEAIRTLKQSLTVPVFANGNILYGDDIERCLAATGAEGVMTAEGNLHNPCLFESHLPRIGSIVHEYLDICRTEAPNTSLCAVRGHLFKLFKPALGLMVDHRTALGEAHSFEEICRIALEMTQVLAQHEQEGAAPLNKAASCPIPIYHCQPYIRDQQLFRQTYPHAFPSVAVQTDPVIERPDLAERPAKLTKVQSS